MRTLLPAKADPKQPRQRRVAARRVDAPRRQRMPRGAGVAPGPLGSRPWIMSATYLTSALKAPG